MASTITSQQEAQNKAWAPLDVWDFTKCTHAIKIRKDFKLGPKLFACLGGDYQINGSTARPHFTLVYKCDDKVRLALKNSELMLCKKMTANLGGAKLDITPSLGLQLDEALKPNLSLQVNNLRPMKVALGCLCVGVAIGFPVRTKKRVPVKSFSKTCPDGEVVKDHSQLDCEVALGVQRAGSSVSMPCSEVNAIVRLGPSLI